MRLFLKKLIHALIAMVIGIPLGVWGAFHLDFAFDPPKEDYAVKMFELPHRKSYRAALFDINGSYWPECLNAPGYGGELFAHHSYPCVAPEIGFLDGPQIKNYMHWRPDITGKEKMAAIEFLKRNGIHYDGDDNVNFKKGVKP